MRFTAEDYREAAGERFVEAGRAYARNDFVGAHLAAGIAVEAMLRAYRVRESAEFDEKHDLSLLGGAFLRRVPTRRYDELKTGINEISILWRNNHRYCSARKLVGFFNRIGRYGRERDTLKANAIRVIEIAGKVLEYGEMKWRA